MSGEIVGYYDGSTGGGGGKARRITLAGYAARPEVWEEFKGLWESVLADDSNRPRCESLHMWKAVSLNDEFSQANGWTNDKVRSLLNDLSNRCLSPLAARETVENALVGASCTVELDDYVRAQQDCPYLQGMTPEEVCVNYMAEVTLKMLPEDPAGIMGKRETLEMYFDRGEKFMHKLNAPWLRRRKQRGVMKLIHKIEAASSAEHVGLQAADFLAWLANRDWSTREQGQIDLSLRLRMIAGGLIAYDQYDYAKLVARYKDWPARAADGRVPTQ